MARAGFNEAAFDDLATLWDIAELELQQGPTLVDIANRVARAQAVLSTVRLAPRWNARTASTAIVRVLDQLAELLCEHESYVDVFAPGAWTTVVNDLCALLNISLGTLATADSFRGVAEPDIDSDEEARVPVGYEIPPNRIERILDGLESIRRPFISLSQTYEEQRRPRAPEVTAHHRPGPHLDIRRDALFAELERRGVAPQYVPPVAAAFLLLRNKDRSAWTSLVQKLRVAYRRFHSRDGNV